MIKISYFLLFIALFSGTTVLAQQKTILADTTKSPAAGTVYKTDVFDIHFNGFAFLDDHEFDALIPLRKTISGTRTEVDLGLHVDSLNQFVVGTNALHEFGGIPYFVQVNPVAYYKFENAHWLFNAGEFPRQDLLTQYPAGLLSDTMQYYRPNVEGLLLRNTNKFGYETGWIDWVSRQTPTQRNEFMAGGLGTFRPSPNHPFYISYYFLFEHDAGTKSDTAAPIRDSGGGQIRLGLDYSHRTIFDSLVFEAGGMQTQYRVRSLFSWRISRGFVATAYMSIKRFSIMDDFYKGDPSFLTFASPFYIKPIFNRFEFMYNAFVGKHLQGQFFLALYQSPTELTDTEPGFRVTYDIGRKVLKMFSDN